RAQAPTTRPASTKPVSVRFLTKAEGEAAIVDETTDPYFKLLQPMEIVAKTGAQIPGDIAAERDGCRRLYRQAVLSFQPAEMRAIEELATKISRATDKSFPVFARTPWSFIKIGPGIEGNVAFTRGNHIILPVDAIN